jgi:hypothetical protein
MRRLRTLCVAAALTTAAVLAGCSIRYDAAGVTRVGIGLWGFGDPPGVDWNLDWPRRDVPDLPAAPHGELPPLREPPRGPRVTDRFAPSQEAPDRHAAAIDDNRDCDSCCAPPPTCISVAARAGDRGGGGHR